MDQKIVVKLRQCSLKVLAEGLVEMLSVLESIIQENWRRYTSAVVRRFEKDYLQRPTIDDAAEMLNRHAKNGFPGSFGSLSCSDSKLDCSAVTN